MSDDKQEKKKWLLQALKGVSATLFVSTTLIFPPKLSVAADLNEENRGLETRVAEARAKLKNAIEQRNNGVSSYSAFSSIYAKDGFDKAFDKSSFGKTDFDKAGFEKASSFSKKAG